MRKRTFDLGEQTLAQGELQLLVGLFQLRGEGLPFAFERFRVLGRYDDLGKLGQSRWIGDASGPGTIRNGERPAPNTVVSFDGE